MFESYDVSSLSADLAADLASAAKSPVEVSQFCVPCYEPGGVLIADPELTLELVLPLIADTMTEVINVGSAYDYLPDNLSYALYGAHDLWPLLLRLNGAAIRADFVGPTFTTVRQASAGLLLDALKLARTVRALRVGSGPVAYGDLTVRKIPAA